MIRVRSDGDLDQSGIHCDVKKKSHMIFLTGKPTIFVGLNMGYERKNKNDAKVSDLGS